MQNLRSELETARNEVIQKETQWYELNDKFVHSSVHMLEETIKYESQ